MDEDPFPASRTDGLQLNYALPLCFFLQIHDTSYLTPPTLLETILSPAMLIGISVLLVLLLATALIAASEVAFLGLSPTELKHARAHGSTFGKQLNDILEKPELLLATLLVGINFINIAIVLVFNRVLEQVFHTMPGIDHTTQYVIELLIEIFVLVLLGEIMPKVYASSNKRPVAEFMAAPIILLRTICRPVSMILVKSTHLIESLVLNGASANAISQEELDNAIEITVQNSEHAAKEKEILKGLVKFGNVTVRQIMRPRVDVVFLNNTDGFTRILHVFRDSEYSRIPVFNDNGEVEGIMFAKDLLAFLGEKDNPTFNWQSFIKPALFIREVTKIDKVLELLQKEQKHLAIVVDEHGGVVGIVTLEDILEEIVGEIEDEFDSDNDYLYRKVEGENSYLCEAQMMLNDICKLFKIDTTTFDDYRGQADSIGGLVINFAKKIPAVGEVVTIAKFNITITEVDERRVCKVKISEIEDSAQQNTEPANA